MENNKAPAVGRGFVVLSALPVQTSTLVAWFFYLQVFVQVTSVEAVPVPPAPVAVSVTV